MTSWHRILFSSNMIPDRRGREGARRRGEPWILSCKPLGMKKRLNVSALRAKRSVEFAIGHCQQCSLIMEASFALRGSPTSYMTRSPIDSWVGPEGSQLSNHREMFCPSPTIYFMSGRSRGLSCSTFLQVHEQLIGMCTSQSEHPLRRFALAQVAQFEDGRG